MKVRGCGEIFEKYPWNFYMCHLPDGNSRQNEASPLEIKQDCVTPHWNFQGQKPRPIKIPHDFFLINPASSTSVFIDLWNFQVLVFELPCVPVPVWTKFLKLVASFSWKNTNYQYKPILNYLLPVFFLSYFCLLVT